MSQTKNRAIVKNGRLETNYPITSPEGTEVIFEPTSSQRDDEAKEAAQLRIFASLTRIYETGQTDLAERHNEHQP